MRSLLVALDETPAALGAAKFAVALAGRHGASVTGAGVLDVDYLTAPEPRGIGTGHYKVQADIARLKRANERNERLGAELRKCLVAENVAGEFLVLEGDPDAELCEASKIHDLIVIGRDSDFHGNPGGRLTKTVERLLKDSCRPLIVTPDSTSRSSRIVIAYDGSAPSARALQIFTLLGLGDRSELHVIAVDPDRAAADRRTRNAATYLARYGYAAAAHPIASEDDPADLVIAQAQSLDAGMLVMGAHGHRGWREALLGSFTTRLLARSPTPLFIHH
jgi:nucleotide-binding universal stress UspA family protein